MSSVLKCFGLFLNPEHKLITEIHPIKFCYVWKLGNFKWEVEPRLWYLTSQTAQSLEALASVESLTKSTVFNMAFFTCLTTVQQRGRERSVGMRRWGRWGDSSTKKKERLNEKPVTSGISYEVFRPHLCVAAFQIWPH